MREYRFSLTHIVPYKGRIVDTGEYGSVKTGILAYFMQRSVVTLNMHVRILIDLSYSHYYLFNAGFTSIALIKLNSKILKIS